MKQYLDLCHRIVDEGVWVENKRTGKRCLTVINADLEYNVGANEFPLVTSRTIYWTVVFAELLGYLCGHANAARFIGIGCNACFASANERAPWIAKPYRKGEDARRRVSGAKGRHRR